METLAIIDDELSEISQWDDAPPPNMAEEEMDILAFELWHRGSWPELVTEDEWLGEEEALRCHASCL
jgi:hypothetical protein